MCAPEKELALGLMSTEGFWSKAAPTKGILARGGIGKGTYPTFLSLTSLQVSGQVTSATDLGSELLEINVFSYYFCKQNRKVNSYHAKIIVSTK